MSVSRTKIWVELVPTHYYEGSSVVNVKAGRIWRREPKNAIKETARVLQIDLVVQDQLLHPTTEIVVGA